MDVSCPKCGATNRNTSRFCARCGELLHHDEEGAAQQAGSEGGLDLPWLRGVQDRASKPKTERLTDAQTVQPAQPPQPKATPPSEQSQPLGVTESVASTPSEQALATDEPNAAEQGPPSGPIQQEAQAAQPAPDPNEAPPPWVVSILEPTAASSSGQEQTYEQEELEHIMPWVHGQPQTSGQGSEQATQANASGLPPWLSDITVQETLQSASGTSSPEGRISLPPDLEMEGIEPFVPPPMLDEAEEAAQATGPQRPPDQVPEWLRTITRKGEPEPVPTQGQITGASLAPVEVTSSIEGPLVRDIPVRPPRAGAVEVLAGLVGPSEVLAPRTRRISHDEVHAQVTPEEASTRRGALSWLLPDGIIYLVIVGVLLAVLIVKPQLGDTPAPTATGVQAFYSAIEAVSQRSLPQERTVLVAYDWDATRSAEMSVLAESVTRHLMARHIGFITVSTNPQGPGFAQQITSRLSEEYGYVYGREYLVMGYLPGSQAALGALASNFRRNLPIDYEQNRHLDAYTSFTGGSRLQGIENFALIITLASDEAEMRNWVEQVGARTGVPIVAAVPQGLEPLARPYLNIPNAGLKALISGPTGALQYTKQLQAQGISIGKAGMTPLSDRLNAQSAAQLLVALVIIAALVKMFTRKVVRR